MNLRNKLETGLSLASVVGALVVPNTAHAETTIFSGSDHKTNIVEKLWESDLGRHIDEHIAATSPEYVKVVAEFLGVEYTGQDLSGLIFSQFSSPEDTLLGGIGIFKTPEGYTFIKEESDEIVFYEFDSSDKRAVFEWATNRLGWGATLYWNSVVNSILDSDRNQEPPLEDWENEVANSPSQPLNQQTQTRSDCTTDWEDSACQGL